jgi:excisionase family DNA binding protein
MPKSHTDLNGVQMQKLLTVPEVAAVLRKSKWGVYRAIAKGEVPAVRLTDGPRGPLRVPEDELVRYLFRDPDES